MGTHSRSIRAIVHLSAAVWIAACCPLAGVTSAADASSVHPAKSHWAFQPVVRPPVPSVPQAGLVRSPIDAFLLERLEAQGLTYSPPAEKRDLIRRAKFDLLGLPPSPEEVERFLADQRPDAYERLIDGYLASPHYGETWGRLWLDLVRFAETAGFKADPPRPLAYKYRDYVIQSFNDDKPYDRFVSEQLAGDELFPESIEALTATGYNRMWPDESNASDILRARQDALNDLTGNVGSVFLAMSVGCAQCHDHKFDPILQTDFYRLQAFFAGIVLADRPALGTAEQIADYRKQLQHWLDETASVRGELHGIEVAARTTAGQDRRVKFPRLVLDAIDTAAEDRTAYQHQLSFWCERQILIDDRQMVGAMTKEQKQRRPQLQRQLQELLSIKPGPPADAEIMATVEIASQPPPTYLLAGGSYDQPLQEVQPGFPSILAATGDPSIAAREGAARPESSGRRSALARWLTDPRHPLTARVIVNRVWQEHFGRGLVANANDFGTLTPPPSHPQLLDWLADKFVEDGWSLKRLHRLIMTSNAYRQATLRGTDGSPTPSAAQVDPENQLYWHFARRRLTAERVRDAMLAVAGDLNDRMYGPGDRAKLPAGVNGGDDWKSPAGPGSNNRRSVYVFAKRNLALPMLQAFDLPDMHESCARRAETTTAPQALTLLNSDFMLDVANQFAAGLLTQVANRDDSELVSRAYRTAFGRAPNDEELQAALEFINRERALISESENRAVAEKRSQQRPLAHDAKSQAALADFCHSLLNANEFLYVE